MVDRYEPTLNAFVFDADETAAIDEAMKAPSPWDHKPASPAGVAALKSAKEKIRTYHLQRHNQTCCYCRANLNGAGSFMMDREHILPKSKPAYRPFCFAIWNLAVACKRCNMQFKKADDSFVVDKTDPSAFQLSDNYRLVHPNFDCWEEHFTRLAAQVNAANIVLYRRKRGCPKADFTYRFFALKKLEVDSFDQAQGRQNFVGGSEAVVALREIITRFQQ